MQNYKDLLQEIIDHGYDEEKNTNPDGTAECRTGVFARSLFHRTLEFDLTTGKWPMTTLDKKFPKSCIGELLWCMNGERHLSDLLRRGVKFWNKWPYARLISILKQTGVPEEQWPSEKTFGAVMEDYAFGRPVDENILPLVEQVDDMGPLYGYQWRNWTDKPFATYIGQEPNKYEIYQEGPGYDQLADVVHKLVHKPNDRRMIVSSWNVSDMAEMVLPPCHACHINHYVSNGELTVKMVQRSCDMPIGVPVNIAFYALYTMILAQITGLKPGKLIWSGDNVHIYSNQIDAVKEMLTREERELPTIKVPEYIKTLDDLKEAKVEDFIVEGYNPHPKLDIPVAV